DGARERVGPRRHALGRANRRPPARRPLDRPAVHGYFVDLWPHHGDRGARLQPAPRLHGAPLVRPLRVLRGGRLRRRADGQVPQGRVDGAVPLRRDRRIGDRHRGLWLGVRPVHAHLLQYPDARAFAGALVARVQVLLGHGRHRRPPRADAVTPGGARHGQRGQDRLHVARLLLLCARHLLRLRRPHVGHRQLAIRQGAPGDPRQRDARGVRRRPDLALPLRGLSGLGCVHRARGGALGAAERPHDARHHPLELLGRDGLHDRARRLSVLRGSHHRRGRVQLPQDLRGRLHGVLAAPPRGRAGRARALAAIRVRDQDVTRESVHGRIRAGIARSFQLVNLFDQLTVLDNVALTIFSRAGKTRRLASLASADRAVWDEALEILRLFGLEPKARMLAGGVSQGERKLLDVAIAYALRPKLLFLDEPTSGVSTREKTPIMDTVTSVVRSTGISAAIIEHDMDVVFNYSDRIVAMHQGTILADGTPDEIRRNEAVTTTLIGTTRAP